MRWTGKKPTRGCAVRVKVSFYHHYGIYVDDDHVIAFGYPDNTGVHPDEIAVVSTPIDAFLAGGMLEVGVPTMQESMKNRSAKRVVEYAEAAIGRKGYNILHNNCEHFMNECLTGEHESDFLNSVRAKVSSLLKD